MAEGLKINHDQKDPGDGRWGGVVGDGRGRGASGAGGRPERGEGGGGEGWAGDHTRRGRRVRALNQRGEGGEGKSWREDVFVYCRDTGWTLG